MTQLNKSSVLILAAVSVFAAIGLVGPTLAFAASPAAVNLGSAGNFVILAKTGISTTGSTAITGDIGVSPAAATYITGFALTLPAAGAFSTSALVTGKVYATGYADPTPANLTTAVLDMQTAYTDAAGRASTVTELGAGNIGGLTLASGVYKWGTGVTIPTDVTLTGSANDVWIFQIAQTLTVSSGVRIILAGGAQASNIFWQVAGQTTIGTTAVFNGNILGQTAIVLNTGAALNGRALAQTAVTLDSNVVTKPASSGSTPEPQPTPTPAPAPSAGSQSSSSQNVSTSAQSSGGTQTGAGSASTQTSGSASSAPEDSRVVALRAQLIGLSATLQALQSQRNAQQISSASAFGQSVRAIANTLGKGSQGGDVKILQEFLISQNKGASAQALARVGATAYFGEMTRSALAEFQANVGISPAIGNFGAITRGYVSAHY